MIDNRPVPGVLVATRSKTRGPDIGESRRRVLSLGLLLGPDGASPVGVTHPIRIGALVSLMVLATCPTLQETPAAVIMKLDAVLSVLASLAHIPILARLLSLCRGAKELDWLLAAGAIRPVSVGRTARCSAAFAVSL